MQELNFDDLSLRKVPVTIAKVAYELREATGAAAAAYRGAMMEGSSLGDDGAFRMGSGAQEAGCLLISRCLFRKGESPDGLATLTPVSPDTAMGWPDRIVRPLVEAIKEISGMEETEDLDTLRKQRDKLNERVRKLEDQGKNPITPSPESTTDGSD